jgi:type II secretory pathway predicted ATPase ExeA
MYESYWQLHSKPFAGRGEPDRCVLGQSHQSALLRLGYGLLNLSGPALILGPSGVGKSCLVRLFAQEHPKLTPFVNMLFPTLQPGELLRSLAGELTGMLPDFESGTDLVLARIRESIRKSTTAEQQTLIAFDDAHQLSDESLLQVVLPLLNLAEADPGIRLNVLLIGQPVLSARIRRLSQLAERISVTTPLTGWTSRETADYVARCLTESGGRPGIFSPGAVQRLFEVTGGNPRRINRLADMALVIGFADALPQITESQIDSISCELMPAA